MVGREAAQASRCSKEVWSSSQKVLEATRAFVIILRSYLEGSFHRRQLRDGAIISIVIASLGTWH